MTSGSSIVRVACALLACCASFAPAADRAADDTTLQRHITLDMACRKVVH